MWLWLVTPDGMLADANDAALDAVDAERASVVWRPVWDGPWFSGASELQAELRTAVELAGAGEAYRTHADLFTPNGLRHADLTVRAVAAAAGGSGLLLIEGRDRTDERRRDSDQRTLLDALTVGVLIHGPDGSVRDSNPAARRLVDASRLEGPTATNGEGSPWIDADGKPLARDRWPAVRALAEGDAVRDVVLGIATHDGTRWLQADALPLRDGSGSPAHGAVTILHDVTEVRRQARLIEHHTHLDPLTGLPNRRAFLRELERAVSAGEPVAVLLCDLDGFRDVNGRYGHRAGDELLRWMARRLERAVRPDDMPARLGGDEFALLLRHVADDAHLDGVAERVQELVAGTPRLDGHDLPASASLGVARIRADRNAEELLHDAGVALGQAKSGGGARWAVFDPELVQRRAHMASFEAELRRATELEQLEVHYQPLVDAKGHAVIGAEALMRWRHPTRGLVPPGDFIPAAEQTGLIVEMEAWLQREALAQLRRWNRSSPELHLSMNLSARQLERPDFVDDLKRALEDTGANPANVVAEVTETFAMQHPLEAARVLNGLADLGVTLAIDDFGTGYSNLGQLQHLPFQIVKIDRSFLEDVPENPRNFALVRTIIAMGQSLDLKIIAEGVETKTQADFLYWEGATWLQGYFFGRPMPSATFGQVALGGAVPFSDP